MPRSATRALRRAEDLERGEADQHERDRKIQFAENDSVRRRERDQQDTDTHYQPGLVRVPEGTDRGDHRVLFMIRTRLQQEPDAEVERRDMVRRQPHRFGKALGAVDILALVADGQVARVTGKDRDREEGPCAFGNLAAPVLDGGRLRAGKDLATATEAEAGQLTIYQALGVDPSPGGVTKLLV